MNRTELEKQKYLSLEQLVFYTGATKKKVSELVEAGAFRSSKIDGNAFHTEFVNKFMLDGRYPNGTTDSDKQIAEQKETARAERAEYIASLQSELDAVIDDLPDSAKSLDYNRNSEVKMALSRAGLI